MINFNQRGVVITDKVETYGGIHDASEDGGIVGLLRMEDGDFVDPDEQMEYDDPPEQFTIETFESPGTIISFLEEKGVDAEYDEVNKKYRVSK